MQVTYRCLLTELLSQPMQPETEMMPVVGGKPPARVDLSSALPTSFLAHLQTSLGQAGEAELDRAALGCGRSWIQQDQLCRNRLWKQYSSCAVLAVDGRQEAVIGSTCSFCK